MKISCLVKPKSKKESVQKIIINNTQYFLIAIKSPPVKNKANIELIKILAKYFEISPQSIRIVSGHTAKRKIVEITD